MSKTLGHWAYENGITMDFPRPEKTTDNALIESFNGSFHDGYLNLSPDDAQEKIE
ncbi:transposase [Edwardsiella anguillarum]|nr:transposase [Edwardsiella anguillarum]